MNRYNLVSFVALLVLVTTLPIYALYEPLRMEQARESLRRQFIADATEVYLETCAGCHGAGGEGIAPMPPLNKTELARADYGLLYQTIARASHGTAMAAWHIDEGGILSDYQIEELITLIRHGNWAEVRSQAAMQDFNPPAPPVPNVAVVSLAGAANPQAGPHECRACHDEPALHTDRFGLDCARCHTMAGWLPARLTYHTFRLDHGGDGKLACSTCHTETYNRHTCYQCHNHQPDPMRQLHTEAGISDFDDCVACHPTGQGNEADSLTASYRQ